MRSENPEYKSKWNHLRRIIKRELEDFTLSQYQNYVASLETKDQSLWKATKRLLNKHDKIPSLVDNGKFISSDLERAEAYAGNFEKMFSNSESEINQSRIYFANDDIDEFLKSPPAALGLPLNFCNPKEIRELIRRLKTKKSLGHDLIPVIT